MIARTPAEVQAVLLHHAAQFTAHPDSYEVHATKNKPRRWIPRVLLLPEVGEKGQSVVDYGLWFETEKEANNRAWYVAAEWLESHA